MDPVGAAVIGHAEGGGIGEATPADAVRAFQDHQLGLAAGDPARRRDAGGAGSNDGDIHIGHRRRAPCRQGDPRRGRGGGRCNESAAAELRHDRSVGRTPGAQPCLNRRRFAIHRRPATCAAGRDLSTGRRRVGDLEGEPRRREAILDTATVGPVNGPLLRTPVPPAGRGCSSVGRAPQSHCGGQGFKSPQLHQSHPPPACPIAPRSSRTATPKLSPGPGRFCTSGRSAPGFRSAGFRRRSATARPTFAMR